MSQSVAAETIALLERLQVDPATFRDGAIAVTSPVTGEIIANVVEITPAQADAVIAQSKQAFALWRKVPAPRRGEFVRLLGEELRAAKDDLGALVSIGWGKVKSEGLGEVQEMIDICDFAVGLSRQLQGSACRPNAPITASPNNGTRSARSA
jgi:aldehyde dehydrogenase (NAD+)